MIRKHILTLAIVLLIFCVPVSAYTLDDIEWDQSIDSRTLHWGDTITDDNEDYETVYEIQAEDFNTDGLVHITISKGAEIKKFGSLKVGESLDYRDLEDGEDIRVNILEVNTNIDEWSGNMEDPTAKVRVYRRGIPQYEITIETEEDTYDPKSLSSPDYILVNMTVENNGGGKAWGIDLHLDTAGLELESGKLDHRFSSLEIDEKTGPVEVKLKVPLLWNETDYDIKALIESRDINDDLREGNETHTITIEPKSEIAVTKIVSKEVYMGQTAHVLVTVRNAGICDLDSILVTDSLLEEMELKDSINLEKTISLEAGETVDLFEYSLRPLKSGDFSLPKATAEFTAADGNLYEYESESPDIEINGPTITVIQKTATTKIKPGEKVTITVTSKNEGNRDASVTTTSTIPPDSTYLEGYTENRTVLKEGKSGSYTYTIRIDEEGTHTIPAATATFIDMESYKGEKISNTLDIVVSETAAEQDNSQSTTQNSGNSNSNNNNNPSSDNDPSTTTEEDDEKVEPGFEAIFSIVALAGVFLIMKKHT